MTDEEIIKAMECLLAPGVERHDYFCKECPYDAEDSCVEPILKDALALIKRQRAEAIDDFAAALSGYYAHLKGNTSGLLVAYYANEKAKELKERKLI